MTAPAPYPLAFCLNLHRADTLADVLRAIQTLLLPVRDIVAPGRPFPVGLYLSDASSRELDASPSALASFRDLLEKNNLFVRMVNAFPYGGFHSARVKTAAYHPDWRTPERLDYTTRCARILAALMPHGASGTLTTVPGGWLPDWTDPAADTALALKNLLAAAETCRALRDRTGRTVRIAIEPEPGCAWSLFDPAIEEALPPEIGWCLDTCHSAVDGLPLPAPDSPCWPRILRVQLSAALEAPNNPVTLEALAPFAEPAYLHQTRLFLGNTLLAFWPDLPEALADLPRYPSTATIRTHYHVPLSWPGTVPLRTTRHLLTPDFLRAAAAHSPLEVETYTYSVLPPSARTPAALPSAIASELASILPHLPPA